ncbi:dipeptidyl aminopeptidase [Paenibacillus antri]|uniref:Dipeptidyl aminopeptidase n=2 Tax=Paenibacillus antri TaxID=2582848 RepID=A0A5R9G6Z3_9BACL|nr:dipeptidyl aminopeptidase [Paenibacillus antri]
MKDGVPPLLEGVTTPEEWARRREEIRSVWAAYVGELPERLAAPQWERLSEVDEGAHVRVHLRYRVGDGDEVPAYLLVPRGGSDRPRPAVLALHPTAPEGKADVATRSGRDNRRYGLELAERGFVVLAPDTITAGERVYPGAEPFRTAPYYERFPRRTAVGKMLSDHMHAVDLLASLPEADGSRIGAIGHSLGGYNAFFLAGFDERVRAIAVSCGFATFAGDPERNRWGLRDWFSHLPRLTDDLENDEVPFEFHEIAGLAAPTPWFNWNGTSDPIFPHWRPAVDAMEQLERLYRLLGAEEGRLTYRFGSGGHDFPRSIREAAYDFLADRLSEGR